MGLGLAIGVVVSLIRLCGIRLCAFWAIFMSPSSGGLLSWSRSFWCILLAGLTPSSGGRLCTAISACSINSGAYVAEIFRGGIESIDKGQMEAGRSLGMTWWQTMRHIILPQAFKRIIPPLGNEFIAMLKDSSWCPSSGSKN